MRRGHAEFSVVVVGVVLVGHLRSRSSTVNRGEWESRFQVLDESLGHLSGDVNLMVEC